MNPEDPVNGDGGERVVIVDKKGNGVGEAGKLHVHREGILHRAFSVFIFDGDGRFLLQQRAVEKYHSGGLWSNTCCSHPRPGEGVHDAARRRLVEEMGMRCDFFPLFETSYLARFSNGLIENEYVHVFAGTCDMEPSPNPAEVMDYKWMDASALRSSLRQRPDAYSFWFKQYWDRAYESHRSRLTV